jgi:hypothetical protein
MDTLPETVDGFPNLCGCEDLVAAAIAAARDRPIHRPDSRIDFARVRAAAAIALHFHQPLLPAGGPDLQHAPLIGHLQHMLEHPEGPGHHDAPVFRHCYARMGDIVPALLAEGLEPRVMIDLSGTLLHGLVQMQARDVIEPLRRLATDPALRRAVEWLGAPWGHAVAPSTPPQDYRLHVRAWQHHFAAVFGLDALARVRGFAPAEMALPNHPQVAYGFVRTLLEAGYRWVLVQEHTVEQAPGGGPLRQPHRPHRLVCRSADGETASIVAIVKTQGSDTKLVGQMQPWAEARGLAPQALGERQVPPLVTQIADGENGGVMMNEFPPKYLEVVRQASGSEVPLLNVSEYLEHLEELGVREDDFAPIQPIGHARLASRFEPGAGAAALERAIEALRREDPGFHVEGGSWTGERSWVRGYDNVLGPMEAASAAFQERVVRAGLPMHEPRVRNALLHLLVAQTSCFRYWGQGEWTERGREVCRRALAILEHDC